MTVTVKGRMMLRMSEAAIRSEVPDWTLGWKLKRALDFAGVSAQDMAAELGVHVATVSRWMNDRETPRRAYVMAWALRTGVPVSWFDGDDGDVNGSHITAIMQDPPSTGEIVGHAKPIADPDTVAALRRSLGYGTRTGRRAAPRSAR